MDEIQLVLKKLHEAKATSDDVRRFCDLVKHHGQDLESSMNAFMKIVFITVRNALKRPKLPALERLYLLELLEFRAGGWSQNGCTTDLYDKQKTASSDQTKPLEESVHPTGAPLPDHSFTENSYVVESENVRVGPLVRSGQWLSCSLELRHKFVGSVIGRKGCRVDAIRKYTRTRINLAYLDFAAVSENTTRMITLSGKEENIRRAITLIKLCVAGEELPEEVYAKAEEVKRQWLATSRNGPTGEYRSPSKPVNSPEPNRLWSPVSDVSSQCGFDDHSFGEPSGSTPVLSKQLSDSGHHEDLSPTGGDGHTERHDQEKSVFIRTVPILGHDLRLQFEDEKLLNDIVDLLVSHYNEDISPATSNETKNYTTKNRQSDEHIDGDFSVSGQLDERTESSSSSPRRFPLARGRGRANVRKMPLDKKPYGLQDRKRTMEPMEFAFAIKELRQFQKKIPQERRERVVRPKYQELNDSSFESRTKPTYFDDLANNERQLTSTPAVQAYRNFTEDGVLLGNNSNREGSYEGRDSDSVELSSLNQGILVSESTVSGQSSKYSHLLAATPDYEQDEVNSHVSTGPPENTQSSSYPGYTRNDKAQLVNIKKEPVSGGGSLMSQNVIRQPINPSTPISVIVEIEKSLPRTSLCAAKRRELFEASSPRKPAHFYTYSRQELVEYSNNRHTRKPPAHWGTLTKLFPLICLKQPWEFFVPATTSNFRVERPWALLEDVMGSRPNVPQWSTEVGGHGSGDHLRTVEFHCTREKNQVITDENSVVSLPCDGAAMTMKGYIGETISDAQNTVSEQAAYSTSTDLEPLVGLQVKRASLENPNKNLVDTGPLVNSATLNSVQEAIENFEANHVEALKANCQKWPGITWSKWDIRPKGVRVSVAEVLPQPSVSILSKSKDDRKINVDRVDPFCMQELLTSLRNISVDKTTMKPN